MFFTCYMWVCVCVRCLKSDLKFNYLCTVYLWLVHDFHTQKNLSFMHWVELVHGFHINIFYQMFFFAVSLWTNLKFDSFLYYKYSFKLEKKRLGWSYQQIKNNHPIDMVSLDIHRILVWYSHFGVSLVLNFNQVNALVGKNPLNASLLVRVLVFLSLMLWTMRMMLPLATATGAVAVIEVHYYSMVAMIEVYLVMVFLWCLMNWLHSIFPLGIR